MHRAALDGPERLSELEGMIFAFEQDFAGSLRCIPMIARQKLDLVGIKLSLRQWSRLTRDERDALVSADCSAGDARAAYRDNVLALIARRSDEPAVFLDAGSHDDWARDDRMPAEVVAQAARDAIAPPDARQWAQLSPLQRFALIKLARSAHENANFAPAMREFGLHPAVPAAR